MAKSSDNEDIQIFEPPKGTRTEEILDTLAGGTVDVNGMMPWSSNYTFLGTVVCDGLKLSVIYKPCRGERPLWDFDHGTLCRREVSSYLVSRALGGWPAIPPTALGHGPHGPGSVQLFVPADYDIHFFTIQDDPQYVTTFQQIALFDYLVNNADRKSGHCLIDSRNKVWCIDHGLTFHTDYKLRTVIWDFANQRIPSELYQSLKAFNNDFTSSSEIYQSLETHLSPREIEHFCRRLNRLLKSGRFPEPHGMRDYPYPPV